MKEKIFGVSAEDKSAVITEGLGGKKNIISVACCATRLRCMIADPDCVDEGVLRQTGALGIIRKGQDIQVVYGLSAAVIKSELETFLADAADVAQVQAHIRAKAKARRPLCSPFKGRAASITEARDEAFAERLMGDGYVVVPSEGAAYAPEDCKVSFVFPTNHAIGLVTEDGLEFLIHAGIDTVMLDGVGFETFVEEGQHIKKGDKLMAFDLEYIRKYAKSDDCIVLFTSLADGEEIVMKTVGEVDALDEIAEIVSV